MKWLDNYSIAIFCGIGLTLGLAPFYFFPVFVVAISTFYLVAKNNITTKVSAFKFGWWLGFAYFCTSLYWFVFPLLVDAKQFAWLIPLAIFGLPALFSLYFAGGMLSFYVLKNHSKLPKCLTFAVIFTCVEWVMGHAFTGFPWNNLAYVWSFNNNMMQIVSVIGIYGLLFITIISITAMVDFFTRKRYIVAILPILLLLGINYWGTQRLHNNSTTYFNDVTLRLVKGNVPQKINTDHKHALEVLNKYLTLSSTTGLEDVSYIIWPEGVINFRVNDDLTELLKQKLGRNIIFGANHFADNKIYNSLYSIDYDNGVVKVYDKKHLVPFGEYVPLKRFLPFSSIVPGRGFSSGAPQHISMPDLPTFAPSICYEGIFPNEVVDRTAEPAEWILNITNDAWFGTSTQPYQHFDMSKVRAIEEGLPLVRVTNAGISAVIDGYGRIIQKLEIDDEGILDVKLPKKINSHTIYSVIASYIEGMILLITIAITLYTIYYLTVDKKYVRRKF